MIFFANGLLCFARNEGLYLQDISHLNKYIDKHNKSLNETVKKANIIREDIVNGNSKCVSAEFMHLARKVMDKDAADKEMAK